MLFMPLSVVVIVPFFGVVGFFFFLFNRNLPANRAQDKFFLIYRFWLF